MRIRSMPAALALALGLAIVPAGAETRGINIPIGSLFISGTSNFTSDGLRLPDSDDTITGFHVTLPPDYKKNTPIYVRYYLHHSSPCNALLKVYFINRKRPGRLPFGDKTFASFVNGGIVTFPANPTGRTVNKSLKISPPNDPSFAGQKPGDALFVQISRAGTDAADTCNGYIFVDAIEVRYRTP
jgi:hypothetical protein